MAKKPVRTRRHTRDDINDAMFSPNISVYGSVPTPEKKARGPIQREVTLYTLMGDHDIIDDDGNPVLNDEEVSDYGYAKRITIEGNQVSYYIKRTHDGHFYNPLGILTEGTQSKKKLGYGRKEYEYVKVGAKAFKNYVKFLRTKNSVYLTAAQREEY